MVKMKERWRPKGEVMSWGVVSLKEDVVGLSGPGPCRSMLYVTMKDLEDAWEKVEEAADTKST